MAKQYEGSPEDEAKDARGAKASGMSKKAYEGSARDRREDAAGERRMKRRHKAPAHRPPERAAPAAPMPGQHEFSAEEEQAMRQGGAQSRGMPSGMADEMPGAAPGMDMDQDEPQGM